jgi:hypothetical protein
LIPRSEWMGPHFNDHSFLHIAPFLAWLAFIVLTQMLSILSITLHVNQIIILSTFGDEDEV